MVVRTLIILAALVVPLVVPPAVMAQQGPTPPPPPQRVDPRTAEIDQLLNALKTAPTEEAALSKTRA